MYESCRIKMYWKRLCKVDINGRMKLVNVSVKRKSKGKFVFKRTKFM